MEDRIMAIEKELAIMAATLSDTKSALEKIDKTLNGLMKLQADTQVLNTRITQIDKEAAESFKRVHTRIDKIDDNIKWVVRAVVGVVIVSAMSIALKIKGL